MTTSSQPDQPDQPDRPDQPEQQTQPDQPSTARIGKYLVEVIAPKCIGAASCVAIAPHTFRLNEDDIAEVIAQHGDDDPTILLAAQSCPTAAIVVTDTETGKQVWPVSVNPPDSSA